MFDELADAIAATRIPVDRTAVVEAIRLSDRLGARVSEAVGQLDTQLSAAPRRADEPPLPALLRRQARLSYADAERLVFTAQRLRQWPLTRRAWLDGVLSGGQVGAIVANVPPAATLRYARDESEVVPALIGLSVTDTAAATRRWSSGHGPDGV